MPIVSNVSNKQMNVGKMQIKGVTMATSHGSPPMKRYSKLACKCLEKGGPDGRQSWGSTLQTKNLQARGTTLQARQNGQETQVGKRGNRPTAKETNVSNRQRQMLAMAKKANSNTK